MTKGADYVSARKRRRSHAGRGEAAGHHRSKRAHTARSDSGPIGLYRAGPGAIWFALAVTASIASAIVFLSLRLLFSSILTFALVALVCLCSLEKESRDEYGFPLLRSLLLFERGDDRVHLGRLSQLSYRRRWVAGSSFGWSSAGLAFRQVAAVAFDVWPGLDRCSDGGGSASAQRHGPRRRVSHVRR